MRTLRTVIVVATLAAFLVPGCGPGQEATPEAAAPATAEPAAAPATAGPVNDLKSDGLVADWAVVVFTLKESSARDQTEDYFRGTFDKDYLAPVGGQDKAVLTAGTTVAYKDEAGADQQAKASLSKADLDGRLGGEEGPGRKVIYAFCNLRSDKAQKLQCYFGSDDEANVWVNGQLVHKTYVARGCEDRQDSFTAELKAGLNPMMVKVSQRSASWVFVLEALAGQGAGGK